MMDTYDIDLVPNNPPKIPAVAIAIPAMIANKNVVADTLQTSLGSGGRVFSMPPCSGNDCVLRCGGKMDKGETIGC